MSSIILELMLSTGLQQVMSVQFLVATYSASSPFMPILSKVLVLVVSWGLGVRWTWELSLEKQKGILHCATMNRRAITATGYRLRRPRSFKHRSGPNKRPYIPKVHQFNSHHSLGVQVDIKSFAMFRQPVIHGYVHRGEN